MVTPQIAIGAGVGYLHAVAAEGRWRAFALPEGAQSDGWVTAYVAATLGEAGVPGCPELIAAALRAVLAMQRPDGRFGWGASTAADADSTVWALRLAAACGAPPDTRSRLAAARRSLARHVRPGGGVAAFLATDQPIGWLLRSGPHRPFAGWCAAQPCVTAAAASVPAVAGPAIGYLLSTQAPDGSWPAYWWVDREYSVAHAAEALAGVAGLPAVAAARAGGWACRRLGDHGVVRTAGFPDGSPFATALALRAVLAGWAAAGRAAGGDRGVDPCAGSGCPGPCPGGPLAARRVAAAVAWLCRSIRLTGAWHPSALLRVPHPDDTGPDGPDGTPWHRAGALIGAVVADDTRVFTTATVVAALARAAGAAPPA